MSEHYSRQDKNAKKSSQSLEKPTKHIKTGFSALQKTVALVGSILSIIVASITINNAMNGSKTKASSDTSTTKTVVIKEKDTNSNTTTSSSATTNNNQTNDD